MSKLIVQYDPKTKLVTGWNGDLTQPGIIDKGMKSKTITSDIPQDGPLRHYALINGELKGIALEKVA